MEPRNPNKPFMVPGTYVTLWFDEYLKHISTIPSELNRIDLVTECESALKEFPIGFSYVVVMPIVSSLITTHTPQKETPSWRTTPVSAPFAQSQVTTPTY
jgi:hypothetical protein